MNSKKKTARVAGILYLALGIFGMLGILYVPSQIIVPEDTPATIGNITNNEFLYRTGIAFQLISQVLFVYLVLQLHRLLKPVNKHLALQMVVLVMASIPIGCLNMLNQVAALILLGDFDFLANFSADQLGAFTMIFLKLYEQGVNIVQIFWGLWLIPFGLLVYKSEFIPRVIGFFLVAGGVGYVIASFTGLLTPQYAATVNPIVTLPSVIGEFSAIFWLLIKGVREKKTSSS